MNFKEKMDLETQFLLVNLNVNHIFYVPSDTENNVDAIKEAAQKRINDYLKNDKVTLSFVSTASEYLLNNNNNTYEDFSETFNDEYKLEEINENDLVYHVVVNINKNLTNQFDMVIKRDSSKMVNPTLKTVDLLTGVEVNTDSIMRLDTTIQVNELNSGSEYEKIIRLLDLTDSITYDIKLYSETLENYITKLDDGTFEVKIPILEKLQGKNLTAYYVDSNGNIEEYGVEIKDGYAIFKTNHFSIYTLGYKAVLDNTEENPKTADSLGTSLLIGTISLMGLTTVTIYLKKI